MELASSWIDLVLDNEFDWECVGGNNDDMDGKDCLTWADSELDRELFGGKNDDMEGEKFGTGSCPLDDEVLPDGDLAAGKMEKMEGITAPGPGSDGPGRDMWYSATGLDQII